MSDIFGPSIFTVNNSTLEHNQAHGGDGSPDSPAGDGWGGAIANLFTATTSVTGSTLANNLAIGGQGDEGANGGNGLGGGAYNDDTSSLALSASTVTDNHANGGDGGIGGSAGQGIGGGIYNLGLLDLDDLTMIDRNHASTRYDDLFST
jgi:hypothetical protein